MNSIPLVNVAGRSARSVEKHLVFYFFSSLFVLFILVFVAFGFDYSNDFPITLSFFFAPL